MSTAPSSPVRSRNNRYIVPLTPSPSTPSTSSPYTPLSFRSFSSSNVTTPASAYSSASIKRLNLRAVSMESPQQLRKLNAKADEDIAGKDKSIADIADNWRSRANDNGIRVSSSSKEGDGDDFADDEASDRTTHSPTQCKSQANEETQSDNPLGPGYVPKEALLPPPFLSTHRRPRAQSHSLSLSYPSSKLNNPKPDPNAPFFSPQPKSHSRAQSHSLSLSFSQDQEQSFDMFQSQEDQSFSSPAMPLFLRSSKITGTPHTLPTAKTLASSQQFQTPARRPLLPLAVSTSNTPNMNTNLYTPPQKKVDTGYAARLLRNGSLSEPGPRTRTTLGESGNKTDLFDISEDFDIGEGADFEHDDYAYPYSQMNTYQHQRPNAYPYVYSDAFLPPTGTGTNPVVLHDPFYPPAQAHSQAGLSKITEGVQLRFDCSQSPNLSLGASFDFGRGDDQGHKQSEEPSSPYALPVSRVGDGEGRASEKARNVARTGVDAGDGGCSVCGRIGGSQAVLIPCAHPLCSACLTGALNIVGEKDMECCVCKIAVEDFKLVPAAPSQAAAKSSGVGADRDGNGGNVDENKDKEGELLPSAFEFFEDVRARSSPPPTKVTTGGGGAKGRENVVLRIDNVPWDITPPVIRAWLCNPPALVHVHVLLDRRGKTLSHAFVEFDDEEVARAALRGAQKNSVLGKGKRARGVTVTRSGQEELMRSLFPSWKGNFDGSRPSLSGLPNEHVIQTLEMGLITDSELNSLMHLIRSPDSHFLKVPELPFHALISVLVKFPSDVDSRVFWSGALRDVLFDITFAAVHILLGRCGNGNGESSKETELLSQVFVAAVHCQAFTSQQIAQLSSLVDATPHLSATSSSSSSPLPLQIRTPVTHAHAHRQNHIQVMQNPNNVNGEEHVEPFSALAREFGVEAQLVQALAQRLAAF